MPERSDRHRLVLHGLPVVRSLEDLSDLTHLSVGLLYRLSRFPVEQYKTWKIKKRSGGERRIHQPSEEMKALQAWILRAVLDKLETSPACKGFEPNSSTSDNARPHVRCRALLCLDIEDFYPSVKASWVYKIFEATGYSRKACALFTDICTLHGGLPQGAPTSPKLANLACWRMDRRLMGFAGRRGIMYTRYADDMAFSAFSYRLLTRSIGTIERIVRSEGFRLNRAKSRFSGPSRAHVVTGLVIHDDGFGIGRRCYRQLRARIHRLCRIGEGKAEGDEVRRLDGWLSYVRGVDRGRAEILSKYLAKLRERYPDSAVFQLRDGITTVSKVRPAFQPRRR